MMTSIRNIYCVGRNFGLHAAELGNDIPDKPMIFLKPTHSIVPMNGGPIALPTDRGEVHFETELVIRIAADYRPGITVDELVDAFALGIDFTLRDVQSELKKKGHPWTAAKGFLNSAPITEFRAFPGFEQVKQTEFTLLKNGDEAQRGNLNDMIFNLQVIVDFIARHFGLGQGDIIYTGTPAGVAAVSDGDRLELLWGNETWGACTVRLENA
ncbi:fumarylacetoacetate hydrolase family protein [Paenibacillus thalictri]|uniref:FAA hydrolase family protein n=1 Tax=Paenibacillus thalictri TaxID=2527873 RepID=A0A4Q9DZB8_9BACL|nr:fumarylacetoacetate hydrolase family protein [Paenibacillus thalictri]TBL81268.1 FAA hydrolase family protein [Paenibacillus thalictri]